jgi:putative peptide zinc metalloprotease protein
MLMLDVRHLKVEQVLFEYIECDEDVYIFNTNNERMVQSTSEMIDYLKAYEAGNIANDPAIDNFIFGAGKRKLLEFKLKGFSISKTFFSVFLTFMDTPIIATIRHILTWIGIILLPLFFQRGLTGYFTEMERMDWKVLVVVYGSQLLITMIHELGHYYYYQKYITSDQFRFGFLLRYFFLFMFYTNVNFMDQLPKKKQLKIMLAGVQIQLMISGIICLMMMCTSSNVLTLLFFLNVFNILINLVPFIKTDGYWIINLLIGSQDYMNSFKAWIKREKRDIKRSEILLSLVNIVVIFYIVLTGVIKLIQMFL